jgi:hypothetical protein
MTTNLGSGSSTPPPPHSPAGLANIGKTSTCHTKREEREVAVTTMMLRGLGGGGGANSNDNKEACSCLLTPVL